MSTCFALASTNKTLASLIDWESKAAKLAAKSKRQVPKDYAGHSPMRACALLCYTGCMRCKTPRITKITWEFGVRYCKDCLYASTISDFYIKEWNIDYKHLPHTTASLYHRKFGEYTLDFYWKDTVVEMLKKKHNVSGPEEYMERKRRMQMEAAERAAKEREIAIQEQKRLKEERKKFVHETLKPVLKASKLLIKDAITKSKTYKQLLDTVNVVPDEDWPTVVVSEIVAINRAAKEQQEEEARRKRERIERFQASREITMPVVHMSYFEAMNGSFVKKMQCPLCTEDVLNEYSMLGMWMHMVNSHNESMPKDNEWTDWLKKQSARAPRNIERIMRDFARSEQTTLVLGRMTGVSRKHLHRLACALRVDSRSLHETERKGLKDVLITKPVGWTLDMTRE